MSNDQGQVTYLNSGDWVENLTALEYFDRQWHLYQYQTDDHAKKFSSKQLHQPILDNQQLFNALQREFQQLRA